MMYAKVNSSHNLLLHEERIAIFDVPRRIMFDSLVNNAFHISDMARVNLTLECLDSPCYRYFGSSKMYIIDSD
jgi:hypothetical protein